MKQKKNKPTRQSINVQTFLYPYKHVSQYSPHTNQARKPNDTRNDTRPLDEKPSQTRPRVREKTIPKKQWADNAHVTLPSALNVILSEVGSGKGKTKNELGGKQLYRPQPIKRTDIIKKGERRETEHDNQKMKKKHQLKDDRQNGETGLDEEIDEAKRKKWFIKFQKKYHELKDMRTCLPITIKARSTPIRLV